MLHTGSKAMKLSTLAYNNNIANLRLFRDFYYQFLHRVQNEISLDLDPRFTQSLYSLYPSQPSRFLKPELSPKKTCVRLCETTVRIPWDFAKISSGFHLRVLKPEVFP